LKENKTEKREIDSLNSNVNNAIKQIESLNSLVNNLTKQVLGNDTNTKYDEKIDEISNKIREFTLFKIATEKYLEVYSKESLSRSDDLHSKILKMNSSTNEINEHMNRIDLNIKLLTETKLDSSI